MKLTLRNLLAHHHGVLADEAAEELESRIANCDTAQAVRSSLQRTDDAQSVEELATPGVDDSSRGSSDDPGEPVEVLTDSVISPRRGLFGR